MRQMKPGPDMGPHCSIILKVGRMEFLRTARSPQGMLLMWACSKRYKPHHRGTPHCRSEGMKPLLGTCDKHGRDTQAPTGNMG